jgi:hypothetical protein
LDDATEELHSNKRALQLWSSLSLSLSLPLSQAWI